MASKDLRVNVVVNAKTKQLDKAFKKMNRMQTQLNRQAAAQNRITSAVNKTTNAYKKSGSVVDGLTKKVGKLAKAYLGVMAARTAITASDTITKAENKLNYINATSLGSSGYTTDASGAQVYSQATLVATQKSMDKMYASAQKVRMGYGDMMTNVSKSMTLASDAFGGNVDNAIRFQEVMAEAYAIGGASDAEMSSSMYQMIQALGSGILQGDELRSVREGAPLAYKEIEKLAQEIYGAEKNLKDMASQGLITSDIVVKAMLRAGTDMDEAFANTEMTFAQAWTNMKNTALKSFEPVLQKLNDLLNSPVGEAIVNGIGTAIQIVARALLWVVGLLEKIFVFIQTNWGVISKILGTIIAILSGALLYYLGLQLMTMGNIVTKLITIGSTAVATAIKWLVSWAALSIPMLLIIAVIAAIVIALIWMSDSFTDACGNIVGAVFWALSVIGNTFISGINTMIQSFWTGFIAPIASAIDWIINAFNGAFDGIGGAFANLLGQMLSNLYGMLKPFSAALDTVFGWNLTEQIEDGQSKLKSWGLKEGYVGSNIAGNAPQLPRLNNTDAFNFGYDLGEKGGQWISDKASGLKDKITGALNLGGLPTDGIVPNLEDINGNTEVMADSMQLTAEDLKYLRDVANMEWKKEFTTANITVDMTNNNTVSNDYDLNSLAIGLRDVMVEEMYAVANGTYV